MCRRAKPVAHPMYLISWNVNGIRAAQKKGFLDWLAAAQPDVLCVQETKAWPEQLDDELLHPPGYQSHWATAEKKGYSGVATYTRVQPVAVRSGFGPEEFDREGRVVISEYPAFTLLNVYFPNGSRDHHRVPYKLNFYKTLLDYCDGLRAQGQRLVICGDFNTAHKEIDLARPKSNRNTTGFLPVERAWLDTWLRHGYVDAYRHLYPDQEGAYTWWTYMSNARARNVGWRLDMFYVSADLLPDVQAATIMPDVLGSDHCPVGLRLNTRTSKV